MATIIQNLTCFDLKINKYNQTYYFDEDLLHGRKITGMFFLFSAKDQVSFSPLYDGDEKAIASVELFAEKKLDCFLTIFDKKKRKYISNFDVRQLVHVTDDMNFDGYNQFVEIPLNCEIDTDQSFLTARLYDDLEETNILAFVTYETHNISVSNPLITGSVTVEIPIVHGRQNYILNEFIANELLRGKRIKQIKCGADSHSYLYLKCKTNFIENMPTMPLVKADTTKEIWFDNIEIDFDQSYLKYRKNAVTQGFTEKITFFY